MKTRIVLTVIIILASILRVWDLANYPSGLNADEASIGYNAYSILKTGKDEYDTTLPLIFKSFGDYKPGFYFYIVLPFVATMGLTELAVRFPSALFGIGTVFLIYLLGKEIFKNTWVGLSSAFLLSISPWHIHFSRGGWETNVATFFITLGVLLLVKGLNNVPLLFFSMLSFLASMYTYQSPRLVVPVFLVLIAIIYHQHLRKLIIQISSHQKRLAVYIVLLILISLPLIIQFISGQASARFAGLSFLSDPGPILRINELRGEHVIPNSPLAILLHNKPIVYLPKFLGHYLDHFTADFLFINGDPIIRNKVPETGQFYLVESVFLIIGVFYLVRLKSENLKLILTWLLVAPLASAMTYQTPHALRGLNMVVPLTLIMGYGSYAMLVHLKNRYRYLLGIILATILIFEFTHYLESYYIHYPKRFPLAWEYGFREMVSKLNKYEEKYNKVVITDRYDQPYILLLFYKRYDPAKYQPHAVLSERDKFNFGTVRSFDKYEFRTFDKEEINKSENVLFVGTKEETSVNKKSLDKVDFPNGEPAFIFLGT